MTKRQRCPRCGYTRAWRIRRGQLRCAHCRRDWRPGLPLRLRRHQWQTLVRWHVRGLSARAISHEMAVPKTRVLRALVVLRQAMAREVPPVFRGTVEVDETYLGGQAKNRRRRPGGYPTGRATVKTPVFGILCRGGQVWAQVVPDTAARTLWPLIRRRVRRGTTICSDTWRGYTGIATKGYVHRLVDHSRGYVAYPKSGYHINGLEGFWGYCKRRLAAKGGIRRARLPLYLAESVWRYNHRQLSLTQQVHDLMRLLIQHRNPGG